MAKTALFRRELFGFSKADVNQFIATQNTRVQKLSGEVLQMREEVERQRAFYQDLLETYEANRRVLDEVRLKAAKNESTVHALAALFRSLADAYNELYVLAGEQQAALELAKVYETKAFKYEALARQMKAMVLGESMQQEGELAPLPQTSALPDADALEALNVQADGALREMLSDARCFSQAMERIRQPQQPKL